MHLLACKENFFHLLWKIPKTGPLSWKSELWSWWTWRIAARTFNFIKFSIFSRLDKSLSYDHRWVPISHASADMQGKFFPSVWKNSENGSPVLKKRVVDLVNMEGCCADFHFHPSPRVPRFTIFIKSTTRFLRWPIVEFLIQMASKFSWHFSLRFELKELRLKRWYDSWFRDLQMRCKKSWKMCYTYQFQSNM